ncbi:MAG: hypothetical protein WDO15_16250 [Bacteroidota bacterium]
MSSSGIEGRASDSWKILDTENKEIKSIDADELNVDGTHYIFTLAGKYGVEVRCSTNRLIFNTIISILFRIIFP